MTKPVIAGIIFMAVVLGVIIYSSLNLAQHKVRVCMTFNGQTNCGTASGSSKDYALRAATSNACATIASGVGDTMACERSNPVSVDWLKQ